MWKQTLKVKIWQTGHFLTAKILSWMWIRPIGKLLGRTPARPLCMSKCSSALMLVKAPCECV